VRWYHSLLAFAVGILGLALAQFFWPLILLGPVSLIVLGNSVLCPQCRRRVAEKTCAGCGRPTDDVWPLQWLLRPESNSGDVGGQASLIATKTDYTWKERWLMYLGLAIVFLPFVVITSSIIKEDRRVQKLCETYETAHRVLPNQVIECPYRMWDR